LRIVLATLCLNEIEWLPALWEQHQTWPGLVGWIFVEGADREYAKVNPDLVRENGLSRDGTSLFLAGIETMDPRVRFVRHGFFGGNGSAQGKCEARQRYIVEAWAFAPDWIIVIDADEFYTRRDQARIVEMLKGVEQDAVLLRQRHIWCPPGFQPESDSGFDTEVVGGYWDVPHCRIWRWIPGMEYKTNHNWPEVNGRYLTTSMYRFHPDDPQCVHMGFASTGRMRAAKHRYYQSRGEGPKDGRQKYVECRAAWETWKPGDTLPQGAKVIQYDGPVPEVFIPSRNPDSYSFSAGL
jgi:hypothetical protein